MIDKSKMDPEKDFLRYVTMWGTRERHTAEAVAELDDYNAICMRAVQNIDNQEYLLSKAIDMAVEFEKSGFMAGMRWFQQYYTDMIPAERKSKM